MFRRECMKEDKKKILTAAAFLIAAGLVFGMTRSRSGIQKMDESGAVVMSGSLDADGNISWEKNGSAKSDGLPQGDSGSSTEKQELQEPFRDENGSVQGESTVETQEYVENSEKSGVYVYICGEVAAPGVYELSEDSRIYEAVDAAGGFTENAARESINLASKVSDGMQITIYNKEEAASLPAGGTSAGKNSGQDQMSGSSSLVNLNTATKEELMTLKGIGEAKAEDIIRYREKSGGFKKIEDIMKISGIKEAGFQKIKDNITV